MIKNGKFNTDTKALTRRIQAHEKYGSNDLNQWVFKHLNLVKGLSILDLGCGTGKQALPLSKIIGNSGRILAVDVSQEALDTLFKDAKELRTENQICLLRSGFDDLGEYLHKQSFDRILACYSLYYAQRSRTIFEKMHHALKDGGILFFCGPAKDNNFELKQFHYALLGEQIPPEKEAVIFMEKIGPRLAREFFSRVEISMFQNPLRFDSPETLYSYWSSYNLYDENLDDKFKTAANKFFQNHSVFETVKRSVGIRAIKLFI